MELYFNRNRIVMFTVALSFFAAITMMGLEQSPDEGIEFTALAVFAVAILMSISLRYGVMMFKGNFNALTLEDDGMTIHQPPIGKVAWSQIDDIILRKSHFQRSLGIRFTAPAPKIPWTSRLNTFLNRLLDPRTPHIYLPLMLYADSGEDILIAIERYRKKAGRSLQEPAPKK